MFAGVTGLALARVELIRHAFDAVKRGDWDGATRFLAPDAVWEGEVGSYRGKAAIRDFWCEWVRSFDAFEFAIEEAVDLGSGVLFVAIRLTGRPAGATGTVQTRQGWIYVWTGEATERIVTLSDTDAGRAVAEGLAEKRWRSISQPNVEVVAGAVAAQENVEVVRDLFAATNERDFPRAMSHYAADVELVVPSESSLNAGIFTGRDAVGRWFGDWFAMFDRDARFDVEKVVEVDESSVVLIATHIARGRASGIEVEDEVVWLCRLRAGKIVNVHLFDTGEEALKAVGLE
jgi:ketosteroid isomerase-like protein